MSNVMHQHPRRQQAAYRADTDGLTMVGVVHCGWRCRVCGGQQTGTSGRKKMPGEGWKCAECAKSGKGKS